MRRLAWSQRCCLWAQWLTEFLCQQDSCLHPQHVCRQGPVLVEGLGFRLMGQILPQLSDLSWAFVSLALKTNRKLT